MSSGLLDEAYRLAHLPLVAPDHPRVIARRDGRPYEMGRHEPVFSLVLPIADELLRRSAAYLALEADLKASPLAPKIAWNIVERRRHKLHATLCGSLSTGETPPVLDAMQRDAESRPLVRVTKNSVRIEPPITAVTMAEPNVPLPLPSWP